MAYTTEITSRAADILSSRRLAAAARAEKCRDELFSSIPALRELEYEISALGVAAAKEALAGGSDINSLSESISQKKQAQRALLVECGFDAKALDVEHFCEKCRDSGYLADGSLCECHKKLLSSLALGVINRSSPLELSSFDNYSLEWYLSEAKPPRKVSARKNAERVLTACRRFADDFPNVPRDLLLMGDAGLGKTHLALAVANETLRRGFDVVYCSAAGIFKQIETEYFEQGRTSDTIERLKSCELLVLDDLGAEFNGPFVVSALYDLVNTRLIARRRTIYTSNLTDDKSITRRYGDKISSRLIGCCTVLPLFGDDIRILRARER